MTVPPTPRPRSPLQYEFDMLVQNARRIRDHYLNLIFELTLKGAERRLRTLVIMFLVTGFVVELFTHPITDWFNALRNIFIWSLNPQARVGFSTNPITDFINLAVGSVGNLLRYFAILVFPYWAAIHSASLFLADIFEKPVNLAREFILQVALGGSGETIQITDGEFKNKAESRVYAIGGPGYVQVDRNSAALFEKPDGRPHVIGPTVTGPILLDGFERFRSAIDLRDQHVDFRDENREISSRSLDGIPVSAIDVSLRFSIWRGAEKMRTLLEPNPFKDEEVIRNLVYNQVVPVSKAPKPKDTPVDIPSPIGPSATGLIRGELSKFISEHHLTEFLSSYGAKEVNAAQEQKQSILEKTQQVIPPGEPQPDLPSPNSVPDFTPRSDISLRFNQGFTAEANRRGIQLDWIGVGTWKTPAGIVPEHHLEAWKLSMENAGRGSEEALQQLTSESVLTKTIQMIQNVPLARHQRNERDNLAHRDAVKRLVICYREQLAEAREVLSRKEDGPQRAPLAIINEAIDYIDELLGWNRGTGFHEPEPFE